MEITLYKITDDANVVTKATTVANKIGTYTGTPIPPSSVLHPQIYITIPTQTGAYCGANYAYITEYNRYYFVNNPTWVNNDVWSVQMDVDVLTSNDSGLRALDAFVERSESDGNGALTDTIVPTEVNTRLTKGAMTAVSGTGMSTWLGNPLDTTTQTNFIVAVNCGFTIMSDDSRLFSPYGLTYLMAKSSDIANLINSIKLFDATWIADFTGLDNYSSTIYDIYALPYVPTKASNLKVKELAVYIPISPNYNRTLPVSSIGDFYVVNPNQFIYSVWTKNLQSDIDYPYKDIEPFRSIAVEMFPLGVSQIDASLWAGLGDSTVRTYVWMQSSAMTGDAQFFYGTIHPDDIPSPTLTQIVNNCREPLGVTNLKVSFPCVAGKAQSMNILESSAASISETFKSAQNMSTGAGAAAGFLAGAKFGHDLFNAVTVSSVKGNVDNPLFSDAPIIIEKKKHQLDVPESFVGRPCYEVKNLSGLSGFTTIGDIHLDTLQLFDEEKKELMRILKEGIRL